ncbi:primase homolog protein isoform X2 [Andrographis paniculata]|uniref:primase homolog protein isoform X2 n=1 Tax=Andrographis paniculata TaxID=175694 RepID=UPI0021E80286|nr:primase homolog protein isoform X2 [Andrographis paniculata]
MYLQLHHCAPAPCPLTSSTSSHLLFLSRPGHFLLYPVECLPRISLQSSLVSSYVYARSNKSTAEANETEEEKTHIDKLKREIESLGINSDSCTPGQYDLLYCPKCEGGKSIHRSLSLHISENWSYAMWRCFYLQCGWAETGASYPGINIPHKTNVERPLTVESLKLEMLGDELLTYFAERKISKETLDRNNVMQVAGGKKIIAFTYRRNGQLVGCKYRTTSEKRYWQEKGMEKLFYGLDDIAKADEIIIVEGEIDKLSMEEAGYFNCVSVPNGAPQSVSLKELPSQEKDSRFQYLWNCSDYLDKARRIILATDSDEPGVALAEELARRLGRERCRRVRWPKKNESQSFKDSNEVCPDLFCHCCLHTQDCVNCFDVIRKNWLSGS